MAVRAGILSLATLTISCSGPSPEAVSPVGSVGAGAGPAMDAPVIGATLDAAGQAWVDATLDGFTLRKLAGQLVIEWIPGGRISLSTLSSGSQRLCCVD